MIRNIGEYIFVLDEIFIIMVFILKYMYNVLNVKVNNLILLFKIRNCYIYFYYMR